jgi:uncharacterized protein YihD (DUF1040 family)
MRDINRIDNLLKLLNQYWHEHPDLRLGQLIYNINRELTGSKDIFNIEDDTITDYLLKQIEIK